MFLNIYELLYRYQRSKSTQKSRYYNESKSILMKQSANHSLIPNNYIQLFSLFK